MLVVTNFSELTGVSSGHVPEQYIKYIAYCILGIILSLANPLTIVVVLKYPGLRARKEYILLTGT